MSPKGQQCSGGHIVTTGGERSYSGRPAFSPPERGTRSDGVSSSRPECVQVGGHAHAALHQAGVDGLAVAIGIVPG
jgi:hypothetical protein